MNEEMKRAIQDFMAVGSVMQDAVKPPKRKNDFISKMEKAGIPKRYYDVSFERLSRDGCPATVRDMATKAYLYASHLKENASAGKGLLFFGEVGRMKTTLAVCVAKEAIKKGLGVYFISMPELLDMMISMARNRDSTELQKFEKKIKNVTILILDDFGAEYPKDWVLNKVDAIITHRYNNLKPVIITTNMLPNEIKERYVQRVYDRLRSTSQILGTYGDSLRKTAE